MALIKKPGVIGLHAASVRSEEDPLKWRGSLDVDNVEAVV